MLISKILQMTLQTFAYFVIIPHDDLATLDFGSSRTNNSHQRRLNKDFLIIIHSLITLSLSFT